MQLEMTAKLQRPSSFIIIDACYHEGKLGPMNLRWGFGAGEARAHESQGLFLDLQVWLTLMFEMVVNG